MTASETSKLTDVFCHRVIPVGNHQRDVFGPLLSEPSVLDAHCEKARDAFAAHNIGARITKKDRQNMKMKIT